MCVRLGTKVLGEGGQIRTRDPSTPPTSGGCGRRKRRKVLDPRVLIPQVCYMNSKLTFFNFCLFFFFFPPSGPHPRHMGVPRLGIQLELQLLVYATATPDPSRVCNLRHTSWQCWIVNPLSEARDRTRVVVKTSQVHYH